MQGSPYITALMCNYDDTGICLVACALIMCTHADMKKSNNDVAKIGHK